jgi:hypothetical protein
VKDKESLLTTRWCSECDRWVEPTTSHAAAQYGGIVVTLHHCPGCESTLATAPKPSTKGSSPYRGRDI